MMCFAHLTSCETWTGTPGLMCCCVCLWQEQIIKRTSRNWRQQHWQRRLHYQQVRSFVLLICMPEIPLKYTVCKNYSVMVWKKQQPSLWHDLKTAAPQCSSHWGIGENAEIKMHKMIESVTAAKGRRRSTDSEGWRNTYQLSFFFFFNN